MYASNLLIKIFQQKLWLLRTHLVFSDQALSLFIYHIVEYTTPSIHSLSLSLSLSLKKGFGSIKGF